MHTCVYNDIVIKGKKISDDHFKFYIVMLGFITHLSD